MLDFNIIKSEIKKPIIRYALILYLITLFSQLIYFRENNILPSTGKYDFFLILNYSKEISIVILIYFFYIEIFYIFRSLFYYIKLRPHFYLGDCFTIPVCIYFFYYLKTTYTFNEYLKNWDIIFLCFFLSFIMETNQYLSKKNEYEEKYLDYKKKATFCANKEGVYSKNYKNFSNESFKYKYLLDQKIEKFIYSNIFYAIIIPIGIIYIKNKISLIK